MTQMPQKKAKHWYWVTCACFAGLSQGTGSFIYASNFSKYGFIANGILGPGVFLAVAIVKLIFETSYFIKHRTWFKKEGSAWKTADG